MVTVTVVLVPGVGPGQLGLTALASGSSHAKPMNNSNPQTLNQYIYALDNPNRYSDPTGAVANEIPTHAELEQWIEDDKEYAYNKWGAGKER